ncbi:MAG: TRAP transporter small permease subunit [Deltaproteobacteria bacterium]|nr:TRAP transporter small permease subunit [Deltaproteobacteria bacterium]MBW1962070.1 TRAP transporter small permease subunit [Deltaproteobacteria bacterium]MBW1996144.1 TRAP transporter small permease subunit [Deltaproteobacteria bacterium]MBW2153712.1 TRAP transporter small permease subunit [Deltaproteobacteria bacterium]
MRKTHELVSYLADILDRIFWAASFIALVAMLFLGAMEIFSRFVLNRSFVWVPGMVILCSNWLIFLGMGVYLHRRQNMEVAYFYNRFFTPRIKMITDLTVEIFLAIILAVFIKNTILVILMEQYQSSLINLPIKAYWYTMPLLLGCTLAVLSRIQGIIGMYVERENQISK